MGLVNFSPGQARDRGPHDHPLATARVRSDQCQSVACVDVGLTSRGSSLAIAASDPASLQPFLQQSDESRRRFLLLVRGDVLDDGQNRSLDQHAQHLVGIRAYLAGHADRLGEDMHRVGSAGGSALNPADECVDSWERSVWHRDSIARRMAVRQEHGEFYRRVVTSPKILDAPPLHLLGDQPALQGNHDNTAEWPVIVFLSAAADPTLMLAANAAERML
jgi:hypothetical protein